jgi:hypothetical protein
MPIRPSERARYPRDWKQIRARIMKRARERCECRGECGDAHSEHDRAHRCNAPHGVQIVRDLDLPVAWVEHAEGFAIDGFSKPVKVVLTIAHLDHTPEHNDPANLRALCQRCHLKYDAEHHAKNARATRRGRKAIGELFGGEP